MDKIAVIPARGGSKRIPHKNIKPFLGKPIISYSIESALKSGLFDEVMVSTDDEAIAKIAEQYGAKVPFMRDLNHANDFATTSDVLLDVIHCYGQKKKYFRELCCIYPTAPFVTAEKLIKAYLLFKESGRHALFPVVRYSYTPYRSCIIQNNNLYMKWPETMTMRSQDFEPLYHDAGQFYFIKVDILKSEGSLWCSSIAPMIVPEIEVQDIDTIDDWNYAELKMQMLKSKR